MVTGKLLGSLSTALNIGKHSLVSGVSQDLGGNDEGPGPHGLLEAALTACTILTVQMYAKRKHLPLTSMDVTVTIDIENSEKTHLIRTINLGGDLTIEQRDRLLQIANKCPIHKLLSGKIEIETRLMN